MSATVQVTFDAHDPARLAEFWGLALGYERQPPPPGFPSWEKFAEHLGFPPERRGDYDAMIDPDGSGPRLFFQRVPEGKTAKNRVHLDLDVGGGPPGSEGRRAAARERAAQLTDAGASVLNEVDEPHGWWLVLADPEGNEFCLH